MCIIGWMTAMLSSPPNATSMLGRAKLESPTRMPLLPLLGSMKSFLLTQKAFTNLHNRKWIFGIAPGKAVRNWYGASKFKHNVTVRCMVRFICAVFRDLQVTMEARRGAFCPDRNPDEKPVRTLFRHVRKPDSFSLHLKDGEKCPGGVPGRNSGQNFPMGFLWEHNQAWSRMQP